MKKIITIAAVLAFALLSGCREDSDDTPDGDVVVKSIEWVRKYTSGSVESVIFRMNYDSEGRLTSDNWHQYAYSDGKIGLSYAEWQFSEIAIEEDRAVKVDVYNWNPALKPEAKVLISKYVSYDSDGYLSEITWGDEYSETYEWDENGNVVKHTESSPYSESSIEIEYGDIPNNLNLDLATFLTLGQFRSPLGANGLAPLTGPTPAMLPTRCVYSDWNETTELIRYRYEKDSKGRPVKIICLNPEIEGCDEVYYNIKYDIIKVDPQ